VCHTCMHGDTPSGKDRLVEIARRLCSHGANPNADITGTGIRSSHAPCCGHRSAPWHTSRWRQVLPKLAQIPQTACPFTSPAASATSQHSSCPWLRRQCERDSRRCAATRL
jgi:hypothetical protein